LGDQIEKNEKGAACSTYWERKYAYRGFVGKYEERDYLEDPGVDGRIDLNRIVIGFEPFQSQCT